MRVKGLIKYIELWFLFLEKCSSSSALTKSTVELDFSPFRLQRFLWILRILRISRISRISKISRTAEAIHAQTNPIPKPFRTGSRVPRTEVTPKLLHNSSVFSTRNARVYFSLTSLLLQHSLEHRRTSVVHALGARTEFELLELQNRCFGYFRSTLLFD